MSDKTISPQRFVELIEQIPVMQEKLDRILANMDHIIEHGSLGLNKDSDSAFDIDPNKVATDRATEKEIRRKREAIRKLEEEANELERQLEI